MFKKQLYFFPWHQKSRSVRALQEAIGGKIIMLRGSKFEGSPDKVVINYGSSEVTPAVEKCKILNPPGILAQLTNKKTFFEAVSKNGGPRIPSFTTDVKTAIKWSKEGEVVGRLVLQGHSGEGIVFSSDGDSEEFLRCKLYTKYIKKAEEYRVHIAFGKVIDVQRKVLRKTDDSGETIDPKTVDFRIRSYRNGFVFVRNDIHPNKDVLDQALLTQKILNFDFGAVDVIWNDHDKKAYVLEVNSAPGLEGQTVQAYATAFKEYLNL